MQYVTEVLVEEFPDLADLKQFLAMPSSTSVRKSTIIPMSLLFKDEKYIDDDIQILQEYIRECSLSGNSQVKFWQSVIVFYSSMYSEIIEAKKSHCIVSVPTEAERLH